MREDLPRRPGEHGPDEIGRKGGAPVKKPNIDEPTDAPEEGGDTRHPPA